MQSSRTADPPPVRVAHTEKTPYEPAAPEAAHRRALRAALLGLAAVIVIPLIALLVYNLAFGGHVYPGVKVLGASLGGQSRDQAVATIREASAGYPSGDIQVSGDGHTWTLAPADLGVSVDAAKTVDAAMSVGRDGNWLADVRTQLG